MLPLLLMLVQEVPGPPGDEPVPAVTAARDCRAKVDEIIVCKSPDSDRLRPVPEQPVEPRIPQASARIGTNTTVRSRAEPSNNPFVSGPRLMTGVTIDF